MVRSDPKLTALVALGTLALLAGALLAYVTVRDLTGGDASAARPAAATTPRVASHPFVSRSAGFAVRVPDGMRIYRSRDAARFTSPDRSLVVSVGRVAGAPPTRTMNDFLATLRGSYDHLRLLAHEHQRVDGRPALLVSGLADSRHRVGLRFLVIVVPARQRSYLITSFAGVHAPASVVLPRVDEVANTFRVLAPGR